MNTIIIYVFISCIIYGQNIIICDNFLIVSIAELCNNDNDINYK